MCRPPPFPKRALKKSQKANLKALAQANTALTSVFQNTKRRLAYTFDKDKPFFRYFITLQQVNEDIGKDNVLDHPDYRALPALFEIEKKFSNSRIKIWSVANVNPFGDEIFKHVTLAIDLNFMLKRSQLFAEKLYPGCLLIDVDELAEFADESDLEDIFDGDPGEYDGLDLSDRDLKNKSKRSRRKSKELDLLKKATKLEGGSSRNKMAWDRAQSYASDPLILLVETHKDLNPFEIYSFLEEYTKDMDDYRSEYARYRRADGRYELLKVGSLLLRILRMHNKKKEEKKNPIN